MSSLQASHLDLGRLAQLDKWPQTVCETGLPRWLSSKESVNAGDTRGFYLWVRKVPWRRKWQPAPVFFLGESNGQRILAGGWGALGEATVRRIAKSRTWGNPSTYTQCEMRGGRVNLQEPRSMADWRQAWEWWALDEARRHFGSKSWQSKTIVLGPGREVYWDHIFSSWSSPLCSPWHHDKHQDYFHT